jgi:hypothetical protein
MANAGIDLTKLKTLPAVAELLLARNKARLVGHNRQASASSQAGDNPAEQVEQNSAGQPAGSPGKTAKSQAATAQAANHQPSIQSTAINQAKLQSPRRQSTWRGTQPGEGQGQARTAQNQPGGSNPNWLAADDRRGGQPIGLATGRSG